MWQWTDDKMNRWAGSSAGRALNQKARRNADSGLFLLCGKGFFPQSAFGADSLMVFIPLLCATTCINTCVHIKKYPKLAAISLFGNRTMLHTLLGSGSIAPAAAVNYPGKGTHISPRGLVKYQRQREGKECGREVTDLALSWPTGWWTWAPRSRTASARWLTLQN